MNRLVCFGIVGGLLRLSLFLGACESFEAGVPVPQRSFQFPVGIAVHPMGFALVVSSNFDLSYQSGSLRAIDLNQLTERILSGEGDSSNNHYQDFILDGVAIGNFGSGIKLSPPDDPDLALITVRETNELVLVDIKIESVDGKATIKLECSEASQGGGNENFPSCDGADYLVALGEDDPFDILAFDKRNVDQALERTVFVTFLRSGNLEVIQIPPRSGSPDTPRVAYTVPTGAPGSYDLARSPATGLVYLTSRYWINVRSNPIYYFDPVLEEQTKVYKVELYNLLLGSETRSLDFAADGVTAALVVRNPNMLLFLSTAPDSSGFPTNSYLGEVVLGNNPSRVRNHDNLMFVTSAQDDVVFVVDAQSKRLLNVRENICRGPFDVGFFDRGALHWGLVTCFEDDTVVVLDVDPDSASFLEVLARVGKPRTGD